MQILDLLLNLLFPIFCGKKYIIEIFELIVPFLLHPVERAPFVLLVIAERFYHVVIDVSASVFKFDFAGVQIFGPEKSKALKPFQAQQGGIAGVRRQKSTCSRECKSPAGKENSDPF